MCFPLRLQKRGFAVYAYRVYSLCALLDNLCPPGHLHELFDVRHKLRVLRHKLHFKQIAQKPSARFIIRIIEVPRQEKRLCSLLCVKSFRLNAFIKLYRVNDGRRRRRPGRVIASWCFGAITIAGSTSVPPCCFFEMNTKGGDS